MDLIWVAIQGYKRFEELTKMNLEGRLVALTGPNEAGKSSFLLALQHLNSSSAFVNTGGLRELTRGLSLPPNQVIVEAGFRLSDDDQHAVSDLPGGGNTLWFDVLKYGNGELGYQVRPALIRDLSLRKSVVASLSQLLTDPALLRFTAEVAAELTENIKDLVVSLDSSF
jgi:energy-coupling factor transporter ATP-binding protein EcfA2